MSNQRTATSVVGFPRIGENRELKKILELYWKGDAAPGEVLHTAKDLRARHWTIQTASGGASVNPNAPWQPVHRSSIPRDCNAGAVRSHNPGSAEPPPCIPVTA